jgi:N-acyl-D-amino-acid deacylase
VTGSYASTGEIVDLVLFDPAAVTDNSTYVEPFKFSTGIETLWVSGTLVWDTGNATGV